MPFTRLIFIQPFFIFEVLLYRKSREILLTVPQDFKLRYGVFVYDDVLGKGGDPDDWLQVEEFFKVLGNSSNEFFNVRFLSIVHNAVSSDDSIRYQGVFDIGFKRKND